MDYTTVSIQHQQLNYVSLEDYRKVWLNLMDARDIDKVCIMTVAKPWVRCSHLCVKLMQILFTYDTLPGLLFEEVNTVTLF